MLERQQRMQGAKLTATQRKHVIDTIVDNHAAASITADTARHGDSPVPVRIHDQIFFVPTTMTLTRDSFLQLFHSCHLHAHYL